MRSLLSERWSRIYFCISTSRQNPQVTGICWPESYQRLIRAGRSVPAKCLLSSLFPPSSLSQLPSCFANASLFKSSSCCGFFNQKIINNCYRNWFYRAQLWLMKGDGWVSGPNRKGPDLSVRWTGKYVLQTGTQTCMHASHIQRETKQKPFHIFSGSNHSMLF